MKHRGSRNLVAIVVAISATSTLAHAASPADEAAAEALFDEAKRLMKEDRAVDACPKLVESQRLDPAVGTLLYLGDCYEKTKRLASAWAKYREASAVARAVGQPDREKLSLARADFVAGRMSKLVVSVPSSSDAAGLEIFRDGTALGRAQWGDAVPVDGGEHVVEARAPGRIAWSTKVVVADAGAMANVSVPTLASEASAAPASPSSPSTESPRATSHLDARRVTAVALAGVGLVAAGIGAYEGFSTRSSWNDAQANHCRGTICDSTGVGLVADAKHSGARADIAFATAGIVLAGAAVVWFTAPSEGANLGASVSPNSFVATVRGSW